jgi:(R,R)-butanediol dehydrogenase/meso-butanediol dehydrogenase/diacetyl reductase
VYVVEPLPGRRELARRFGAAGVLDPKVADVAEVLRDLTAVGPDVVIEASGAAAAGPAAIEAARKGGRVVLVGIPVAAASVNFLAVVASEKEVIGSLSHVYDEDFATAVQLLGEGRVEVEPLISARIPLDDLVPRGLHRLEEQAADTLKILVQPTT